MSDQSKLGLGKIITTPQERDAIHIAVAPIECGPHPLFPGQRVRVDEGKAVIAAESDVGIVDPFLIHRVNPGEKFWLYLYPGSITSLRHHWEHPAFVAGKISHEDHKAKSEQWIANHANELGLSADVLMQNAQEWLEYGEHTVQHGSERWRDNIRPEEFWHHYEIVTGTTVSADKKSSFYCCSC